MTISLVNPDLRASLSAAESADLAARLRVLVESGLALEGGLRALAEEVGKPRLAEVLRQLAARLECGEPLAQAIAAPGCRLPVVLRGLILAGVQSGRLPEVLEQFTALDRRRQELRRRVAFAFAYPALLLGFIAVLLILLRSFVAEGFVQIFHDFGMKLPTITDVYFRYSGGVGWTILIVALAVILIPLAAAFLRAGSWLGRLLCWIPVFGPVVRNERYVQFARLMASLLDAKVTLPDALSLATIAMQGTMLEGQCRAASKAVDAGVSLDEAIAQAGFLDSMTCFVYWGQTNNALADAFTAAADAFEARTTTQAALLNMIVLPLAYLFIITFIGLTLVALLLPLVSMIQNLASDSSAPSSAAPWPEGLGVIWILSLATIIAVACRKQAATQLYAMLAMLGAAAEREMPLEGVFTAFGQERGGWMRKRVRRISHLLSEGVPLPAAVENVRGVLPPEAVPLVRVGYDTRTLPTAIRQAIAARNVLEPAWQLIVPKILYICVFPSMVAIAVAYLALNIVPKYRWIFRDFNIRLPNLTRWIFVNSDSAGMMLGLLAAITIFLAAYVVLRYAGSIHWDLLGTGWLVRRRHTATILDGLALAAGQQKPFANAVMQMAIGHPRRRIASRLWNAYDRMQAGENDLEALVRVGLLSKADLALLHAAERNSNLAWAARELADSHRRRMIYRTYALVQTVFPPVIIAYGLIVVVICAAMLLPLITLIQNLAPVQ